MIKGFIHADKYSNQLIRLPLFYELEEKEIDYIIPQLKTFLEDLCRSVLIFKI